MITRTAHSVTPLFCRDAEAALRYWKATTIFIQLSWSRITRSTPCLCLCVFTPNVAWTNLCETSYVYHDTYANMCGVFNKILPSVCVSMCTLLDKGLVKTLTWQWIHTQRQKEYWKCWFPCGPCRIKRDSVGLSTVHLETGFPGFPLFLSKCSDGFQVPSRDCASSELNSSKLSSIVVRTTKLFFQIIH
jgi:hypothetical protein